MNAVAGVLEVRAERRWSSRKFGVCLLVIVLATILRAAGLVDGVLWVDAVKWITGLYMVGNVGAAAVAALTQARVP